MSITEHTKIVSSFKHPGPDVARPEPRRKVPRYVNVGTKGSGTIPALSTTMVALITFVLSLAACGGTGELTRSSAQKIIAESEKFKAPIAVALQRDDDFRLFPDPPDETEQEVRARVLRIYLSSHSTLTVLRHLGYVDVNISVAEPYQVKTIRGFSTPSPWVFNIEPTLTGKGKEMARSQGSADDRALPLARREVVEVTGVRQRDREAVVDFTWKTIPSEAGRALDPATDTFKSLPPELQQELTRSRGIGSLDRGETRNWDQVLKATAGFQKYDDGWRLVSISGLQ